MQNRSKTEYTRPDFGTIALITIDMQNDFLKGQPYEIPGTSEILPRMRKLVETFRRAGRPRWIGWGS